MSDGNRSFSVRDRRPTTGLLKQDHVSTVPMSIRPAIASDAETISQVHVASWRRAYREILPAGFLAGLSVLDRQAMWADSIDRDLPHVLVAEVGGRVVGFSAIGPCRDDCSLPDAFEIWAIYLSPTHWSRGLGRQLWLASRNALLARGARTVSLWVISSNERAIKFYRMAGFKAEASSNKTIELGGVQIEEVRYTQTLDGCVSQ